MEGHLWTWLPFPAPTQGLLGPLPMDPCQLTLCAPCGSILIRFHPRIRGDFSGTDNPHRNILASSLDGKALSTVSGLWRALLLTILKLKTTPSNSRMWPTLQMHSLCTSSLCSVQFSEPVRILSIYYGWAIGNRFSLFPVGKHLNSEGKHIFPEYEQ